MNHKIEQSDFERLSAYMDGELNPSEASCVERRLADDPAWQESYRRLRAIEDAMGDLEAPPVPAGLAKRIIREVPRRSRAKVLRWVATGAGAAAAAATLIFALAIGFQPGNEPVEIAGHNQQHAGSQQVHRSQAPTAAELDVLVVENLDFFRNYEAIETVAENEMIIDQDTMSVLARLERDELN